MTEADTVIAQFKWYSEQMERAFLKNRFETFRHLSADRFGLLGTPEGHVHRQELIALFHQDTGRWVERLEQQIQKKKRKRAQWYVATGGQNSTPPSGRIINQAG